MHAPARSARSDTHADVLGEAGRARYAELAEAAWAGGPPSWRLERIMERLAAGDVDRLVAIKARTVGYRPTARARSPSADCQAQMTVAELAQARCPRCLVKLAMP